MGLNYIASNGVIPGGREVGLEPPTTFTRIVGDGNCLIRALAHIITGSEEQHMNVCRVIVSVTCEQSEICLWEAMSEKVTLTHTSVPVASSMIMNGAWMLRS